MCKTFAMHFVCQRTTRRLRRNSCRCQIVINKGIHCTHDFGWFTQAMALCVIFNYQLNEQTTFYIKTNSNSSRTRMKIRYSNREKNENHKTINRIRRIRYSMICFLLKHKSHLVWAQIFNRARQFNIPSRRYCDIFDNVCELWIFGKCWKRRETISFEA